MEGWVKGGQPGIVGFARDRFCLEDLCQVMESASTRLSLTLSPRTR